VLAPLGVHCSVESLPLEYIPRVITGELDPLLKNFPIGYCPVLMSLYPTSHNWTFDPLLKNFPIGYFSTEEFPNWVLSCFDVTNHDSSTEIFSLEGLFRRKVWRSVRDLHYATQHRLLAYSRTRSRTRTHRTKPTQ